uniref:PH domain-containing protein n=1 Tax=Macrostomum lignano TaxID=282301 RepID=A0A1I8F5D3_9PLAT
MQKAIRVNDSQLLHLSLKPGWLAAQAQSGHGQVAAARYFVLYQNLLFYYDSDKSEKPSGVALLEGSYCDKYLSLKQVDRTERQQYAHCFSIFYKKDGQRHYDLRAESEAECNTWVEAIRNASYSRLAEQHEQLEQKHLHLLQIMESERQSKWNYVKQAEDMSNQLRRLRLEVREVSRLLRSAAFACHAVRCVW